MEERAAGVEARLFLGFGLWTKGRNGRMGI
jgi:hypothetical protein